MWFLKKQMEGQPTVDKASARTRGAAGAGPSGGAGQITTKRRGDAAEDAALRHLVDAGLVLLARNFRTPGRGGGEIDLILRDRDGTLVFVEVRQRSGTSHGGAGASIGQLKRQRIVFAARHYLMRLNRLPPCRFDVVLVQGGGPGGGERIEWLQAAFDAS
jgi:putative endonuclease